MKHRHVIFLADNGKLYSVIVPAWIRFDGARSFVEAKDYVRNFSGHTYGESNESWQDVTIDTGEYTTRIDWEYLEASTPAPSLNVLRNEAVSYPRLYPMAYNYRSGGYELPVGVPDVPPTVDIFNPDIVGGEPLKINPIEHNPAPTKSYFSDATRFSITRGNFPYMFGRDGTGVYMEFPKLPLYGMLSGSRAPFNTDTNSATIAADSGTTSVPMPLVKGMFPTGMLILNSAEDTTPFEDDDDFLALSDAVDVTDVNLPIVRLYQDGTTVTTSRTLPGQKRTSSWSIPTDNRELRLSIRSQRYAGVRSVNYAIERQSGVQGSNVFFSVVSYGIEYVESGLDETNTPETTFAINSIEGTYYRDGARPSTVVTDNIVAEWQQDNVIFEGAHGTLYAPSSNNTSTIGGITVPANKAHCVDWFVADGVTYTVAAWDSEVRVSVDGTQAWAGKLDEFLPPDLFARVDGATPWQHYRFLLEQHPTATGALEFAFETALNILPPFDANDDPTVLPERELEDTWERVIVTLRPAFEDEAKEINANGDECPVKATILPTFTHRGIPSYAHDSRHNPLRVTATDSYTYPNEIFNRTDTNIVAVAQAPLVYDTTGFLWINNITPPQTGVMDVRFNYQLEIQDGYRVFLRDVYVFYEGTPTLLNMDFYTRHDVDLYGYDAATAGVKLAIFTVDTIDANAPQTEVRIYATNCQVIGLAALEDYYEDTA